MTTPKIQFAPERIAEGKRLYELTLTPVPDIAAMMRMTVFRENLSTLPIITCEFQE